MLPPPDVNTNGKLWRVRKPWYGLKDAPRCWQQHLFEALKDLQMSPLDGDPCVWMLKENGAVAGLIEVHVDDLKISGPPEFFAKMVRRLRK